MNRIPKFEVGQEVYLLTEDNELASMEIESVIITKKGIYYSEYDDVANLRDYYIESRLFIHIDDYVRQLKQQWVALGMEVDEQEDLSPAEQVKEVWGDTSEPFMPTL